MAIVNVEINTEKNTLDVTLDGKKVKDVCDISAYLSEWSDTPKVSVNIRCANTKEDKESGIRKHIHISIGSEQEQLDNQINITTDEFHKELSDAFLGYNIK